MSQQLNEEPVPRHYRVDLQVTAVLNEADVKRAYELELPWRLVWEAPVEIKMDKEKQTLFLRCKQREAYSGVVIGVKNQSGHFVSEIPTPADSSLESDVTLVTEPRSDTTTASGSSSNRTADTITLNDSDSMDLTIQTQTDPGDQDSPSLLGKQ